MVSGATTSSPLLPLLVLHPLLALVGASGASPGASDASLVQCAACQLVVTRLQRTVNKTKTELEASYENNEKKAASIDRVQKARARPPSPQEPLPLPPVA